MRLWYKFCNCKVSEICLTSGKITIIVIAIKERLFSDDTSESVTAAAKGIEEEE